MLGDDDMKGTELAPNTLVILVLAVLILVVVMGFFISQWMQGTGSLDLQAKKTEACNSFVSTGGCNGGTPSANLMDICIKLGITKEADCIKSCGC
jgi:hypothetical protein